MFQTKKKLRVAVIELSYRVAELEERLCPMNGHDYKLIDCGVTFTSMGEPMDVETYKCSRCGKTYKR